MNPILPPAAQTNDQPPFTPSTNGEALAGPDTGNKYLDLARATADALRALVALADTYES